MFRPNSPHTVGRGGTRGSARSGTGSKDPGIARRSPSSLPSSFKVAHLGSDRRDQTQDRWGAFFSPRLWRKKGKFRPIHGSRIQVPGSRQAASRRAARPAGSARSSDGRWRRVVRRGRGRCPLDASGGVRPRSRTIDERKKECRVEARGGCALNPSPVAAFPGLVSLC